MTSEPTREADEILSGRTNLGIELGSTRIKACLIDADAEEVLAVGTYDWENTFEDGLWTYSLESVWRGVQEAYSALVDDVQKIHGVTPNSYGAIGISAMMHGYLAFDSAGELLVPFRTWRNTNTRTAAMALTDAFGENIPLRWSIAHLHQAILDSEPHLASLDYVTTLAGYVHWKLTGSKVLGVGDASGMFPIDPATGTYNMELIERYDELAAARLSVSLVDLFPRVLVAGTVAGELSTSGAILLDPSGVLQSGVQFCPPEGDAGTGMVATNSVTPRSGNVSAGTSIFAMVVLERALRSMHHEIDTVTTPSGTPVAMVHCNNGASELAAWVSLFSEFSKLSGGKSSPDDVYDVLFREALNGEADAGGLLAYNYLAGEPIAGLIEGRPLFVRPPGSDFTLANFMRAQLYGVFGTLSLGMQILAEEGVELDRMFAHGGMFRTAGVAQRFLAAALNAPVAIGDLAAEGGAWGIAVLASYLKHSSVLPLERYLSERVFADAPLTVAHPDSADVAGFNAFLSRYGRGLAIEAAAVTAI